MAWKPFGLRFFAHKRHRAGFTTVLLRTSTVERDISRLGRKVAKQGCILRKLIVWGVMHANNGMRFVEYVVLH